MAGLSLVFRSCRPRCQSLPLVLQTEWVAGRTESLPKIFGPTPKLLCADAQSRPWQGVDAGLFSRALCVPQWQGDALSLQHCSTLWALMHTASRWNKLARMIWRRLVKARLEGFVETGHEHGLTASLTWWHSPCACPRPRGLHSFSPSHCDTRNPAQPLVATRWLIAPGAHKSCGLGHVLIRQPKFA